MTTYSTTRALSKPAGRSVVTVDGQDVSTFYGLSIPAPDYLLMEPFAYGSATLTFPQIHATYQAASFGTGDLSWVRKGAKVLIQRVMPDDSVVIDYRGVVVSIGAEGRTLTLEVGGQLAGPASLINKQPPLVRRVRDVGFWAAYVLETLSLPTADRDGPTTGVDLVESGGASLLAFAQDACAYSQNDAGVQWSLMPTVHGGSMWEFRQKDYTTVDATFFNDDARVVLSLRDDLAEQPNTWFGTGITPSGVRIRNGRYPGLIQGPAPTFPGNMTLGDVDADTGTGDGVTVLKSKLVAMHRLTITQSFVYGTYDSKTVAAVKELQRDAGLSATGSVNTATWDALFDLSATGYSLSDSHIAPLVQNDDVRRFDETANGSLAGLNPNFDPTVLRVDRNVDFGAGVEKAAMISWCRGQSTRLAGVNWSGTIRLNRSGGFAGEHLTSAGLTGADVMSVRDIRPGMNAWLPLFDGGTLVHISGVQVDDNGMSATLTVDTLARDLLELSQIIERNAESRRNIRREWNQANRPGRSTGAMVSRDEFFGQLSANVDLEADKWTVIPFVMGQHGMVNRVDMLTSSNHAKFAVAVFSRKVTRKKLNRRIGNPLAAVADGDAWYELDKNSDWFDTRNLLYAAGTDEQPCGYWPKKHTNEAGETTAHPITGRWQYDQPWSYICDADAPGVVWVGIYVDRACVLKRGQLFYAQEDDAV